ncbi:MAG: IspD/TarI family cytidylyltransferase [Lachnospiraceae bacterium]|nr:IspD/TarI family cytidylyltransferase [Lachnospiraceae bacterium]
MGSQCGTGITIIAAAGHGRRFGGKKQFLHIEDKPVYYYSIEAFRKYSESILLVVPEEDADTVEAYGTTVIAGGEKRYDSIYEAIRIIDREIHPAEDTVVLIHDGARPMIDSETIEKVFTDAQKNGAAVATIPVTDTIRTVDGELIDRSRLRAMQTPQAFKWGIIREAYSKFMALPKEARDALHITDDVQIVDQMTGIRSRMSEGNPRNIKITTPVDIEILGLHKKS